MLAVQLYHDLFNFFDISDTRFFYCFYIVPNFQFFLKKFRTTATSKMENFVIIVNNFQRLTIITKSSILDVAAVLDPPLVYGHNLRF